MSRISEFTSIKTLRNSLFFLFVLLLSLSVAQAAPNKVTTYQDANGWKLKVDGKDLYVKGYVWGYSPKGENYSYNLWSQKDAFIKKVLEQDFSLMKKADVNAIRTFSTIPPKWVTYIYRKYGIMSVINPLMGRYGATINGVWVPNTDYSDPVTRKVLKEQVLADVKKFKDVPGVIMFALGNESNYGLSWSSFEIENLPTAEARNVKKATYLYTLYEEVISAGKAINNNHPWSIVNGDIQYIDLVKKHVKSLDVLGVNAYRGISFTGLWKDVKAKLGLPVLFFEFGSDAFNSKDFKEDQLSQAQYLKGQWQEMYQKSYGNGQEGNSIGGFVFQWRDEWWKFKQTENLDKQDTNASWSNGGYKYDFVEGQNNMNEEWWGVSSIGDIDSDGVYKTVPRMAYDVLGQVWKTDPYAGGVIKQKLGNVKFDTNKYKDTERPSFAYTGGSLYFERLVKGDREEINGITDRGYSNTVMAFMDFAFQPTKNIEGEFSVNIIADASESDFEFRYGDRVNEDDAKRSDKIEIYDFQATYTGEHFDVNGFYHVPRYHWGDEGDFFGLLRETTDMGRGRDVFGSITGQDTWNAKAPSGIEFVGKKSLDGLKLTGGKEVYWGANPKAILKYQFGKNKQYTFMHSEDFKEKSQSSGGSAETTTAKSRQTTLQGKFDLGKKRTLEVGGIVSGTNKRGDTYFYVDDGVAFSKEVDIEDTLGFKAKLAFDVGSKTRAYVATNHAGIVANSGDPIKDFGTGLPYSALGNKREYEFGARYTNGSFTLYPRFLYRENLIDANPKGSGLPKIGLRNTIDNAFAVLDNRSVKSAELFFTYDPTPRTFFYEWDNDAREDAKFAFNVGLTASKYDTATDAHLFTFKQEGQPDRSLPLDAGQSPADVWVLKSKMVFNSSKMLNTVLNLEAGKHQASRKLAETRDYYSIEGKFIYDKSHIFSAKFVKDGWGPYDFQRELDISFPEQYELQYVKLLDKGLSKKDSSKIGVKALYRTMDDSSRLSDPVYQDDKQFEVRAFFEYKF